MAGGTDSARSIQLRPRYIHQLIKLRPSVGLVLFPARWAGYLSSPRSATSSQRLDVYTQQYSVQQQQPDWTEAKQRRRRLYSDSGA